MYAAPQSVKGAIPGPGDSRYNGGMILSLAFLMACAPHLYTDATQDSACSPSLAPENSWPSAEELPCDVGGTGFQTGQVPPELVAPDQTGATVSLWQFFGHVTVVDISTMWCAPCQDLAHGVQATADAFAADGLVYVTVLPENIHNEVPTVDDLAYWANSFHITSPVLSDGENWYAGAVVEASFPQVMVLNERLEICKRDIAANDAAVEAAIESCL